MSLVRLDILNVRNLHHQSIHPSPRFNFIYGNNGSGKSALIEAISLLGRAKSFRSASIKPVITFDQPHLVVSGVIEQNSKQQVQVGIQMDRASVQIHKNQQANIKRSDLAHTLPLQIIHPKSFELLDSVSQVRREFIDWGVFNQENNFLHAWRSYKRILAHRNILLKAHDKAQIAIWDKELAAIGEQVNRYRDHYMQLFNPVLMQTIQYFLPRSDFSIQLISGWNESIGLLASLQENLERDFRDGFSHVGPHRGDFQLLVDGKNVKDVVSRGQLKLLVISLKLAQLALFQQTQGQSASILFDDFSAELDLQNRLRILHFLNNSQCQAFITATERHEFGDLGIIDDHKVFYVEQGVIAEVNVPRETK